MPTHEPQPSPERILFIRPSALGDVCRSVPVLVSLRRAYPGARIDWLVQDTFADAVRFHPDLTAVVSFARRRLGAQLGLARTAELRRWLRTLREARYDLVIDGQGLARSGFFAWATRAPRRVGLSDAREFGWIWLNERHHVPRTLHTVDRMLALVRAAGVEPVADLRLHPGEQARRWAAADPDLANRRYAVIAPTSRWSGKRWAPERFVPVAEHLLARGVEAVAIVGAASERSQCGPLLDLASRNRRVADRLGATTVAQLMALVERSALVVACDSAALHMAVGAGRPIVALFGPTRIDRVGPYGREADVLQHVGPDDRLDHKNTTAGRKLMDRITVDEVRGAIDARLP